MELKLNYQKVALLDPYIRSLCHNNNAWIVGSGARFLLDLKNEEPNDYDVIVPIQYWKNAAKSVPFGTVANSHGGFKIRQDAIVIDLWPGDVGEFLGDTPTCPQYAVSPKFMRFLECSSKWLRIK